MTALRSSSLTLSLTFSLVSVYLLVFVFCIKHNVLMNIQQLESLPTCTFFFFFFFFFFLNVVFPCSNIFFFFLDLSIAWHGIYFVIRLL